MVRKKQKIVGWLLAGELLLLGFGTAGCGSSPPPSKSPAASVTVKAPSPSKPPAASGKAGPAEKMGAAAAGGSGPQERLADLSRKKLVGEQEREVVVAQLLKEAQGCYERRELRKAGRLLTEALELHPGHPQVLELLPRVRMESGERRGELKAITQMVEEETRVKIEQAKMEAQRRFEQGKGCLARKEYRAAAMEFERVREILKWAPYDLNLGSLPGEAEKLLAETTRLEGEEQESRRKQHQEEAARLALQVEQERVSRLQERIRLLFNRATACFNRKEFARCEELCVEILRLDPANRYARQLQDDSVYARHRKASADLVARKIEEWKRFVEDIRESRIPYTFFLQFPSKEEWEKISQRQHRTKVGQSESDTEEVRQLKAKLATTIVTDNINFNLTPFVEVIDFFKSYYELNIVITPEARQATEGVSVTFVIKDRSLETTLRHLLAQHGLDYRIWKNIIYVTTPDKAMGDPVLELHDIRDLLVKMTDFPGPTIQLGEGGGESGAGNVMFDVHEEREPVLSEDSLVDMIKRNVESRSWTNENYSAKISNGQLVVFHAPAVQEKIREFLAHLRQFSGSQVLIETRFLEAQDDFLEQIGVEWKNLGGNSLGTATQMFDDPAPPYSGGVFYNAGRDGDIRARVRNMFDDGRQRIGDRQRASGGLALQYSILDDTQFNMVLRAVRKSGRANIMTAPRLTVFNTQRSNILVVNQRAYISGYDVQVATDAVVADPKIGTIQDGVVLDVRPTISNNRKFITLELRPTVATISEAWGRIMVNLGANINVPLMLPRLDVQTVQTTIRVPDRGSVVIAGLKKSLSQDRKNEVPWLSDIPLVGSLFSNKGKAEEYSNVIIIVRAQICDLNEEMERQVGANQ